MQRFARAFKPMTDTTGHLMCEAADALCDAQSALRSQDAVREQALEGALAVALQKTAQLPHDSDFTRGYTEGRLAVAAAIRALKAPTPDHAKGD